MGSDGNKLNDATSFQPSNPTLCANGCGFFGTEANVNLCSKCYRDLQVKEEQSASAKAAMEKLGGVPQSNTAASSASAAVHGGLDDHVGPTSLTLSSSSPTPSTNGLKVANRCFSCKKKVGVLGFQCRCGSTFCGLHRYPEKHECSFDFKAVSRDAIAKANPMVKADKLLDKI